MAYYIVINDHGYEGYAYSEFHDLDLLCKYCADMPSETVHAIYEVNRKLDFITLRNRWEDIQRSRMLSLQEKLADSGLTAEDLQLLGYTKSPEQEHDYFG